MDTMAPEEEVSSIELLPLKKPSNMADDDDLTNLNWLQNFNVFQKVTPCDVSSTLNDSTTKGRCLSELNCNNWDKSTKRIGDNFSPEKMRFNVVRSIPPVAYNPKVHIQAKPPYSFSSLIFMAIESSKGGALPVKDIYKWIMENYPYYKSAPTGWKNTIRHNLSLNKCFQKVDEPPYGSTKAMASPSSGASGKGSLWTVDPLLRPSLLQAVRRASVHVYPYMSSLQGILLAPGMCRVMPSSSKESDAIESMLRLTSRVVTNSFLQPSQDITQENQSQVPPKEHSYSSEISSNGISITPNLDVMTSSSSCHDDGSSDDDMESVKGAEVLLNFCKRRLSTDFTPLDINEVDSPLKKHRQ